MYEKLKSYLHDDTLFIACLILLVGIISFGLGRQSVMAKNNFVFSHENNSGVIFYDIEEKPELETVSRVNNSELEIFQVVASKTGTKYHLSDCPGALQIKEENLIYFDSIELAEAAGYTPAANCPGLQ